MLSPKRFLGERCLSWVKTTAEAMPATAQYVWYKPGLQGMACPCFQMQPGHLYTWGCKARWEFKWMSKGQTSPFQTGNTAPFLPDLKPVPLFYVVLTKYLNKCRSVKGERLKSTRISEIKSCFKMDRLLGTLNKIGDFGFKHTRANSCLHQEGQATWN